MALTPQQAIRILALSGMELYCKVCTVDKIDEAARTVDCTPIDEGAPLEGVNLQANQESGEGVVLIPAKGSYVVVGFLNNDAGVVLLTDKVDKVLVKISGITAEITAAGFVLNDGENGAVNVVELTEKLNTLERDINSLKRVFLTEWIVAPQDGGSALKIAAADWAGAQLKTTDKAELEDTKIKH